MNETHADRVARYQRDHAAYCREVLQIIDKSGDLVPFELNRAQRRVNDVVEELKSKGKPVRLYILKARQLGMSTYIQSLCYKRATLWPNTFALVIAHDIESAEGLHEKSKTFAQLSPNDFRPMQKRNNRRELHFDNPDPEGEPGLKSRIVIQTADNDNLGVSHTMQFVHASEFALYEEVNKRIRASFAKLKQSVPWRPNSFIFLESTARGMNYGKDVWDNRKSGFRNVFISWIADDQYSTSKPLDAGLLSSVPNARYGDEQGARKTILKELAFWYPELDAAALEREALCRLAWRRAKIEQDFNGDLGLFQQEYPLTPEEAFLATGTNVFDTHRLSAYRSALLPVDDEGVSLGMARPPKLYRFDKQAKDFLPVRYGDLRGDDLPPGLRVYETPKKGARYVIGADAAEGIRDGDDAGAQVLRVPEMVQVATFKEQIAPDDFADALAALGRIYNYAWLNPEANGPGLVTVTRLSRALFYPALYSREVFDSNERRYEKRYGFHTNVKTKPMLITDLRGAIREDLLLLQDVGTIDQLMFYVQSQDGKLGASAGKHDDLVMALSLALQMALQRQYARLGRVPDEAPPPPPDVGEPPEMSFEWFARLAGQREDEDAA